jgi:short-subunit dehydrogenase
LDSLSRLPRKSQRAGIEKFVAPAVLIQSSIAVAAQGYAALMRGQRVVVPDLANHAATLAMRLAPRGLLAKIVARQQRGKAPPSS